MKRAVAQLALVLVALNLCPAQAQEVKPPAKEKLLFTFPGQRKGGFPTGKLAFDSAGNLYGTTTEGGRFRPNCPNGSCGTAFELVHTSSGKWKHVILHDFRLSRGGAEPNSGVVLDSSGNVYGATERGGHGDCFGGCGVVFELTKTCSGKWKDKVLHAFTGGEDGGLPSPLVLDQSGNLYGMTALGGGNGCGGSGCGLVFELMAGTSGKWEEKILYSFTGGNDGGSPSSGLTPDAAGNLYGGTFYGGGNGCEGYGCGVIFELSQNAGGKWSETVLYAFGTNKISDGREPGTLIFDPAGNLYGTTIEGGNPEGCQDFEYYGCGVVFEISPTSDGTWRETLLHLFTEGPDGAIPNDLAIDAAGNLYGTTSLGGIDACDGSTYPCGVVYKLAPTSGGPWKETIIHDFTGGSDGGNPFSGLTFDAQSNLYGTASSGGPDGWGVVFELKP
jgi:hypothetical protein